MMAYFLGSEMDKMSPEKEKKTAHIDLFCKTEHLIGFYNIELEEADDENSVMVISNV